MAALFRQHDENGDGVMSWSEFATFAEECAPGLGVRAKKQMFREALKLGGGDCATPAHVRVRPGIIHVIWSLSPYVCSTLWSFTPNDMDDTGPCVRAVALSNGLGRAVQVDPRLTPG